MKRKFHIRNRFLLLGDLLIILIAGLGSFALRLELGPLFRAYLPRAYWLIGLGLIIKPIVFYSFGFYRRLWIYASTQELRLVFIGTTTASIMVSLVIVLLMASHIIPDFPRSALPIDWLLTLLMVGGMRFSMRIIAEGSSTLPERKGRESRVLIIGAGDAGALVVREMQKNKQLGQLPICFLDDDESKQKQQIHGIQVIGSISDIDRTVRDKKIDEVVIAIPSASGSVIRKVAEVCRKIKIPFRTMPGIYELIGGKVNIQRLREVRITDLLRRKPVDIDENNVIDLFAGKRIMVSGAGGSIGLELCKQISRWNPSELIMLGHGENSIMSSTLELVEAFPGIAVHPIVADIRDTDRMENVFRDFSPQFVFHTAAHKHVPLMELNVEEAITNNILGTRNIVEICINNNVERAVMISTDKSIRPTSVMGATKRISELLFLEAHSRSGSHYSVVRFGNVLGSRGSVVPLFQKQIEQGGPITITHPDMERYFMTIPEAAHLVLQASAMGKGGEVFILKMGKQVKILDLAEDLIRLSGLEPGEDIEIIFTGIRPGEKLSEDLWDDESVFIPTDHPEIVLLGDEGHITGAKLHQTVNELILLAREGDSRAIVKLLEDSIPGADIRSAPPPELRSII